MGHAKRKVRPADVAAAERIDRETPLDDCAAETILDAALFCDDGDAVAGIRNAVIAGIALWVLAAAIALLLI